MVQVANSRGENILLFLAQTVGRQNFEQKQFKHSRARKSTTATRKTSTQNDSNEPDMPEHDLDPPKFARKALERPLSDWNTVKAMVMTGFKDPSKR